MAISPLLRAQFEFTEDLASLVQWVNARGWKCIISECGVQRMRKIAGSKTATIFDGVHKPNSNHYRRLAADILLFIDPDGKGPLEEEYITSSDNPAWIELEGAWKALRAGNKTGRGFQDANHVSHPWEGMI